MPRIVDGLTGELQDHVARLHAGLRGGRVVANLADQYAAVYLDLELLGDLLRYRLDHDAQVGPVNSAALFQLSADPFGQIDRHREANALVAARVGRNGRVDADHFAVEIHQRPAAVAGIDGRVGLDEVLAIGNAQAAALGADDARRHRAFQSEGLPEGQDPIADFHFAAASQPCRGERAAGVNADDRQVRSWDRS